MTPRINDEINQALSEHHGFVQAEGPDGKVIVMSMQVYREMMGVGSDEEMADSLRAIDEAMADIEAGHTVPMEQVFLELDEKYGVHG
ncbi:hypothetical protein Mal52_13470 [Symmachiella dynata]|uniref:Uncharacterized protein n=1 Tax=Symmachiella dynata TaxID=2527995 RepID=A0A517ZK82_9PLAN|nr:hypothetical protein [Symmachiella dynata]QDU42878.1 hypothetical protein Mal52_13470 [Symmachiella dynata]